MKTIPINEKLKQATEHYTTRFFRRIIYQAELLQIARVIEDVDTTAIYLYFEVHYPERCRGRLKQKLIVRVTPWDWEHKRFQIFQSTCKKENIDPSDCIGKIGWLKFCAGTLHRDAECGSYVEIVAKDFFLHPIDNGFISGGQSAPYNGLIN